MSPVHPLPASLCEAKEEAVAAQNEKGHQRDSTLQWEKGFLFTVISRGFIWTEVLVISLQNILFKGFKTKSVSALLLKKHGFSLCFTRLSNTWVISCKFDCYKVFPLGKLVYSPPGPPAAWYSDSNSLPEGLFCCDHENVHGPPAIPSLY